VSRHKLSIASADGDTLVTWDPEIEAEVEAALAAFNTAKSPAGGSMLAYAESSPGTGEVIKDFDPDAEAIYMTPQIQGG
jgi:hypothetical protein